MAKNNIVILGAGYAGVHAAKKLAKKYKLVNFSFCANTEDLDKFVGVHGARKLTSPKDLTNIVFNEARLYQSGREKLMQLLEKVAK